MIKLHGKIIIKNCLLISKSINFDLPSIFNNWFTFSSDSYRYHISRSFTGFLKINNKNTNKFGRKALINSAILLSNDIKYPASNKTLRYVRTFKLKSLLKKHSLEPYNTP